MSVSEVSSSTEYPLKIVVQKVPKSTSEKLLLKFSDYSEFDFDYSQSGIWSPPIQRSVFLMSSPHNANGDCRIPTQSDMADKLTKALKKHERRRSRFFDACLCSPKRLQQGR